MESLSLIKEDLRTQLKSRRRALSQDRRAAASRSAYTHLSQLEGLILSFDPFGSEIDLCPLNQHFLQQGRLVLPRIDGDTLRLYRGEELIDPSEIAHALIPGLAFDKSFYRIGYGKGHYDRLLSYLNCLKSGVGFIEQLVEELPIEPHDQRLDQLFLY